MQVNTNYTASRFWFVAGRTRVLQLYPKTTYHLVQTNTVRTNINSMSSLKSPQDTEKGDLVILCMIFHMVPNMKWHEICFATLWNVSYVTCICDPS